MAFDQVQKEKEELGIPKDTLPPEEREPISKTETEEKPPVAKISEEEEENEDTEDDPEMEHKPKQVSIREHKNLKKALRGEIEDLKEQLRVAKEKPETPAQERKIYNLEERSKKLAESLNFDPEKTKMILQEAKDAALEEMEGRESLSKEDKEALASLRAEKEEREQQNIFNGEWSAVVKGLKEQFPNASDEQISKAKDKMDELAHSEKYHEADLDYVFFKEKENFSKILFSPKQKTFESSRPRVQDDDSELPPFDPNFTPSQFEAWNKRRDALVSESPRDKVRITTRDDSGHLVERYE